MFNITTYSTEKLNAILHKDENNTSSGEPIHLLRSEYVNDGKKNVYYRASQQVRRSKKQRSTRIAPSEWRQMYIDQSNRKIRLARIRFIRWLLNSKHNKETARSRIKDFYDSARMNLCKCGKALIEVPPKQESTGYDDQKTFETLRGEKVRSKAEQIIANCLYRRSVPYYYEPRFEINGAILRPDFVISPTIQGEAILWEHFGLLDDDAYRGEAFKKYCRYLNSGFSTQSNLIITMESTQISQKITEPFINSIIDEKILCVNDCELNEA